MLRKIVQFEGNAFYSAVGIPTTKFERIALQVLKYDCIDEWGIFHREWLPDGFKYWLFEKEYLCDEWEQFIEDNAIPTNERVLILAYEYAKKYRKLAYLKKQYARRNVNNGVYCNQL